LRGSEQSSGTISSRRSWQRLSPSPVIVFQHGKGKEMGRKGGGGRCRVALFEKKGVSTVRKYMGNCTTSIPGKKPYLNYTVIDRDSHRRNRGSKGEGRKRIRKGSLLNPRKVGIGYLEPIIASYQPKPRRGNTTNHFSCSW